MPNFADHPMLSGIYEPVIDEREDAALEVSGEIPAGLRGTFLRNGPNAKFPPGGGYHIFDGDGMLHALHFEDGGCRYANRWVRTQGLAIEEREGRALFGGMTNPMQADPAVIAETGSPLKNVANTHVIRHAGRILCLWEAGLPTEVNLQLETLGACTFDGRFAGPMTAHPKLDPATGELLFFGYSPIPPHLRYHALDADGKLVKSVDIDLPAPVMIHDFATTERHAVFLDNPAVFDMEQFQAGGPMLAWKPKAGARLGVLPRTGPDTAVAWFEIDPCFVVHFLNAYETGNRIVVDGCRIDRFDIGLESGGDDLGSGESWLTRWTIDLDAGSVREEQLAELPGDFPRVADSVAGLENRYGYLASSANGRQEGGEFDCLVKYDLARGSTAVHAFGAGFVTGEGVFAPDPAGEAEDDGWLLSWLIDTRDRSTEVVVLDARDVAAQPLARVKLPRRVPFGFHGSWLAL